MKCHYEVLNVPRDAEEAEIKTAYKKLALRWHPDKNLDNPEEAKEQFQFVQQAYEVLIDRQERAWYDNHREQILRGANKEYEDNSLDVFQYFTTSCFQGYNDEDNGFYTIYRTVFENIAKEDLEHMDNKEEFTEIPLFGNSKSDYDRIVGPFYNYWMSYSTKKSYAWLCPYDINDTRNRRVLKLVEKENKKVRVKAKKERNEEIRNLVAFVRKRDKRVQANTKRMEEKSKENKQKQQELTKQRRAERFEEIKQSSQAEWAKFDNVKSELEEIEKSLAEEFGDDISNSEEDSDDVDLDNLYCVACNKIFKTPKAFENHESSKKHKENVELLKETMLEEDRDYLEEEILSDNEILLSDHEIISSNEEIVITDLDDKISEDEAPKTKSKKKNKNKKSKIASVIESEEEVKSPDSNIKKEDVDFNNATKKQRRKPKKKNADKSIESNGVAEAEEEEIPAGSKKQKKKKEKQPQPVDIDDVLDGTVDKDHCCVSCSANFDSKNKLFEHLKKTGHSVHIPKIPQRVSKSKKKGILEK